MLKTVNFQPLLDSSFWVEKEKEKKSLTLFTKAVFKFAGKSSWLGRKFSLTLCPFPVKGCAFTGKRDWAFSTQKITISSVKNPQWFLKEKVGKLKQQNIGAKYLTKSI